MIFKVPSGLSHSLILQLLRAELPPHLRITVFWVRTDFHLRNFKVFWKQQSNGGSVILLRATSFSSKTGRKICLWTCRGAGVGCLDAGCWSPINISNRKHWENTFNFPSGLTAMHFSPFFPPHRCQPPAGLGAAPAPLLCCKAGLSPMEGKSQNTWKLSLAREGKKTCNKQTEPRWFIPWISRCTKHLENSCVGFPYGLLLFSRVQKTDCWKNSLFCGLCYFFFLFSFFFLSRAAVSTVSSLLSVV